VKAGGKLLKKQRCRERHGIFENRTGDGSGITCAAKIKFAPGILIFI
jgi:hypothetical protein